MPLFHTFFKTLVGKEMTIELKNNLLIHGTLISVDQFLNIKLDKISVPDPDKYPQFLSIKNCFVRGSVIRYIHLPPSEVDPTSLQEATRKEAMQSKMQQ
ncbi:U6 snRNA-associated Sm-like protein LSm2 [Oopsacas minuta]|uniref:U6 snRNA-associated Sm-like protein LSm2 n=1 Tax=Oopsacas minuta TaxID=111878 RepID=A0AAV7KKK0_9METZ|nr:U6 snRNA-associated Sm-like protein LSm2 [Oopsacas minuta]